MSDVREPGSHRRWQCRRCLCLKELQVKKSIAVLAFGLLSAAGAAHANLLVNGSFEDDPASVTNDGDYADYGAWIRLAPGTSFLTGWEVAAFGPGTGVMGVDWHFGGNGGVPKPAQDGLRMIDLQIDGNGGQGDGQGTISQTFNTTTDAFYTLTFYLAGPASDGQGGSTDPRQVNVDITGSATQMFEVPASNPLDLQWHEKTFTFQAIGTATTLTFSPLAGTEKKGFWGPFIDNVNVSAVPEPSSFLLLGAGLAGLGLYRRAKRA
jgi:hypothetical protein